MIYANTVSQQPVIQKFIPFLPLKSQMIKKGSLGKHMSLTGSPRFPGAATFPALAALKMGVDLTYLLLPPEQNLLLISRLRSSDLMVSPLLLVEDGSKEKIDYGMFTNSITTIVFGPGLSRITDLSYKYNSKAKSFYKQTVLSQLNILLSALKKDDKIPIVIDADGIFLITQTIEQIEDEGDKDWFYEVRNKFIEMFKIGHDRIILTPNLNEAKYLLETFKNKVYELPDKSSALMCLIKGSADKIGILTNEGFDQVLECTVEGGLKRCGGMGDCLTGVISCLLGWLESTNKGAKITKDDYLNGVFVGCSIMKIASKKAYELKGLSCVVEDVIDQISVGRDAVLGDFINRKVNINDTSNDKITRI